MAKNLKELRDLRGKAFADARAILDRAEKENRARNEDEIRQYDAFIADVDRLKKDIEDEERAQELEREMAADAIKHAGEQRTGVPAEEARSAAFRKFVLHGDKAMSNDEMRSLTAGTDTQGGFIMTPQTFIAQLISNVKDNVFMRKLATIIPLNEAASCGVPTLDSDVGDADWTPEVKTVLEDTGIAFGKRELSPHMLTKLVKISNKLLRNAALNPESIVNDRMAYKFGIAMEKAYLVGTGVGQPLGVFTASADGIPTSRDITMATGNTTAMTADGLIQTKYSLKAPYMTKAQWLFHRDALSQIAQLKDGNGNYIFKLAEKADVPDMLLGRPLIMSEYAPNTFTSSQYVGMFADFSNYWIADSLALQFMRLNELYAVENKVGFIARLETDGMPVLAESFSRIKLAAS